jgi:ADP-ribosylglycohydrolase
MTLTATQLDRACGVLLGTAAGDSLGAPYEFGPPRGPELEVAMVGGGGFGWEPDEWTDDTSMAIVIAEMAATGKDLRHEEALNALTLRWHGWSQHAKDIGVQTSSVLSRAGAHGISARTAWAESAALHKHSGRTAGNGSLMRTTRLDAAEALQPSDFTNNGYRRGNRGRTAGRCLRGVRGSRALASRAARLAWASNPRLSVTGDSNC